MYKHNPLVTTSKVTQHFCGLKIKEKYIKFENPNNDNLVIEKFLYEKCQRAPGYRVTMTDLFNEFKEFYKEEFNYVIKEKVKEYCDNMFIRLRTGDESDGKDKRQGGWLGI